MMKCWYIFFFTICITHQLTAQDSSYAELNEIEIKGLDIPSKQRSVPASISTIGKRELQRYGNNSLVPVLNALPGVRMEERSPGSYRLSIRGSLLRSPFGVRNVKMYWKDMPLTDAGGNMYLNLLDMNTIGRIEVIKGPAGSIYGAGTGGVVSFFPTEQKEVPSSQRMFQTTAGGFGQKGLLASWNKQTDKQRVQIFQSLWSASGYRRNSRMSRSVTQLTGNWKPGKNHELDYLVYYTDLHYQTPGGLTLSQFQQAPQQARPATASLPSAEQQRAGIFNKTIFVGTSYTTRLSKQWAQTTSIIFSYTNFRNPFISNYETRFEQNIGIRSKWVYEQKWRQHTLHLIVGAESSRGNHRIDSTGNFFGNRFGGRVTDQVRPAHSFAFTQLQYSLEDRLVIMAGISTNTYRYAIHRTNPSGVPTNTTFPLTWLPRLSGLLKVASGINVYASLSKGYSSPTLAEIKPSAGGIYQDLRAEQGWNTEVGVKGSMWRSKVQWDAGFFRFNLRDAIVRRVNAAGAEYFVNSGKTEQKGIESSVDVLLLRRATGVIKEWRIWNSLTFFDFRFREYKSTTSDFSGNKLTGVPDKQIVAGTDLRFEGGFYLNAVFQYTGSLPLTDANDAFADDYRLWQFRLGWKKAWGKNKVQTDIFAHADNPLNESYSLGNDINAFGRRFYNPAPMAQFTGGIRILF
jgi:iron complex outermembrane receptor protein